MKKKKEKDNDLLVDLKWREMKQQRFVIKLLEEGEKKNDLKSLYSSFCMRMSWREIRWEGDEMLGE